MASLESEIEQLAGRRGTGAGGLSYSDLADKVKELQNDVRILEAQKKEPVIALNPTTSAFEYLGEPVPLDAKGELANPDALVRALKAWLSRPTNDRLSIQQIFEAFDLQGAITFSVTVEEAGENTASEVQKWFNFYPDLTELKKSTTVKENVTLTIPASTVNFPSGSKTLPVMGTITASSESWNEKIRFVITVSQINAFLKVPTVSPSTFSMAFGEIKTAELSIENNSETPLTNIKIEVNRRNFDSKICHCRYLPAGLGGNFGQFVFQ